MYFFKTVHLFYPLIHVYVFAKLTIKLKQDNDLNLKSKSKMANMYVTKNVLNSIKLVIEIGLQISLLSTR